MKNIIILIIFLLILSICMFIASCDDFFSPTIEIFNKIEQDHGQSQNQEQKKKKKKEENQIINQY